MANADIQVPCILRIELLEETGEAPLDQEFLALEHGPVPKELYEHRDSYKSELFRIEDKGENRRVSSL